LKEKDIFCLKKIPNSIGLEFGVGQRISEYFVIEAIQQYLLILSGVYVLKHENSKLVRINVDKKEKNTKPKRMTSIAVKDFNYIKNVLIPFFDKLTWFSKKLLDYNDWKIVYSFMSEGKHLSSEGLQIILLINARMNTRRLSTNAPPILPKNLNKKIKDLLNAPSNFEVHDTGKIYIKSRGYYLRGRGNVRILVFNNENILINKYNSIKNCAIFFKVSTKTIQRRLENGKPLWFSNQKFTLKRDIC